MRCLLPKWSATCLAGCLALAGCSHERNATASADARPVGETPTASAFAEATQFKRPMPVQPQMVMPPQTAVTPRVAPPMQLAATVQQPAELKAETPSGPELLPVKFESSPEPARTPQIGYGHAPDYSWLTGELQYVHVRNAWRVRFASVDEEDRYGGSVTLVELGSTDKLANGQFVRVEGSLVHPDSQEPSPAYRVSSLKEMPKP